MTKPAGLEALLHAGTKYPSDFIRISRSASCLSFTHPGAGTKVLTGHRVPWFVRKWRQEGLPGVSFTQGQQDNRDAKVLKPTSRSASSPFGNLEISPAWNLKPIFCFQLFLDYPLLTSNCWKRTHSIRSWECWTKWQPDLNTPGSFGPRMEVVGEWLQGETSCELLGHQWITGWIFILLKSNKKKMHSLCSCQW